VRSLDVIQEMQMIGSAQNDHPFRCRDAVEDLHHSSQGNRRVVLRNEEQSRDVTPPAEIEPHRQNARSGLGCARRRERDDSRDPRLGVGSGERGPAAEAVAGDANPIEIESLLGGEGSRRTRMSGTRLAMTAAQRASGPRFRPARGQAPV